ncbi:MAG: 30S ribosomal protein S6 [Candidatus Zixiibacteriota bacterium]
MIRIYETTFIVNPQAEEAVVDRQVKDIADVITNSGGKILQEDRIGTRRLAYEIKGLSHGHYAGFIFEGNNELLTGLDRFYRLNEQYVRFLTVIFDGDVEKVKVQRATDYFHRDDDRGGRPDRGDREDRPRGGGGGRGGWRDRDDRGERGHGGGHGGHGGGGGYRGGRG